MMQFQNCEKTLAFCLTVAFLVSFVATAATSQPDCVFNKRHIFSARRGGRGDSDDGSEACTVTGYKEHVRDVNCGGGSSIHICCQMPYREEVQKNRQVWFRLVIALCDIISRRCTGRVLCEQACKDGHTSLSGLGRSSYPQVLGGDGPLARKYVAAYAHGEALAVCQRAGNARVDDIFCENGCKHKHPECANQELRLNFLSRLLVAAARVVHVSGMSAFNAKWMVLGGLQDARTRYREVVPTLGKAVRLLLTRMTGLSREYEDWEGSRARVGRRRRRADVSEVTSDHDPHGGMGSSWKDFLRIYNGTDPELVGEVFETLMTYPEYQQQRNILNEVVATINFVAEEEDEEEGIESAVSVGNQPNSLSGSLLLFFQVVALLSLGHAHC